MTMMQEFPTVTEPRELDEAFDQSMRAPVILFKHDPYCPISAAAHDQMTRVDGDIRLIDVEHDKAVAAEAAQRTGVRHESPQVIVLRDGAAAWSASLFGIRAEAVMDAARAE